MLKSKSVRGPTLDAFGQFYVTFGEDGQILNDNPEQRYMSVGIAIGAVAIPLAVTAANPLGTSGFAVGQTIRIQDLNGAETRVITAVTPGVSIGCAATTNAYTTALGARVTVISVADSTNRVFVSFDDPFVNDTVFASRTFSGNIVRAYGTVSAPYTQGEVMTGTGGATGRVVAQGANYVDMAPVQGTFLLTDTITGTTSGATLTAISNIVYSEPVVVVVLEKASTAGAGPNAYAPAATADFAGMLVSVMADVD